MAPDEPGALGEPREQMSHSVNAKYSGKAVPMPY